MHLIKLAVGESQSPIMEDAVEMQQPTTAVSPPNNNVQFTNNAALPNQLKLTTNFNFHIDEQGHLGRVDVSKALCYQSQELANQIFTKKLIVVKKSPMLNGEHHFVDCNNNMNPPIPSLMESHMPPTQIYPQKHFAAHPLSPLNINTQYHPPQFVNHLNWNHPQFQWHFQTHS